MKKLLITTLLLALALPAAAFKTGDTGSGDGRCTDCHELSAAKANAILKQIDGEVLGVSQAEIPGLWRVDMKMNGKIWPLYLDYSETFLFSGNIVKLSSRENLTERHFRELNPVDLATVPLADALLMGDPAARTRVIVFTDPHCPYCSKLHQEIKKALEIRPDIAWLIKLMPIKKGSREAAESILCEKSLEMLDAAFAGRQLPPATCQTSSIEQTLQFAAQVGLRSTPSLILPNGRIDPGYKKLDDLLKVIDENTPAAQKN